jgi:hypothetical protein
VRRERRQGLDAGMHHPDAKVIAATGERAKRQRCTSYGS